MKTKQTPRRTSRAIFLLPLVIAILIASDASAQLYWNTNGTPATWTASNWNTTGTGTFSSAWVSGTNVIFGVANGGTNFLTFASTTIGDVTVNGNTVITSAGTVTTKAGGSIINVAAGVTLTWASQARSTSAGASIWTKNGDGVWDLGAASAGTNTGNSFTLNAGTVIFSGNDALGGTNTLLTINGGVLAMSGNRTVRNTNVVIGGNFGISNLASGIFTWNSAGTINLGTAARTITNLSSNSVIFAGAITNTGSLVFTNGATGTGQLKLSGSNSFSGGVTLNSGRLGLNHSNSLGTGAFTLNGGTLDTDAGLTNANNNAMTWGGDFSFAGTANLNLGTGAVNLSGNRTVTVTANELTVGGVISNTGQLTKAGAGTLILDAASTYSGGTVLNAGVLGVGSATALGSGALTISGGTLASKGSARTLTNAIVANGNFTLGGLANSITLNGNVDLGGAARTITLNNSATFGGVISNGGITLATSDTSRSLTLTGANTYTNATTINAGRLIFTGNGALSSSSALNIAATSAATNDISGITASGMTVGSLAGGANGVLVLGAKNLTAGGDNTSTTFAGAASGAGGSLTKSGNGTMTFTGTSTYTGATTVNGGRFVMNGTNTSSAVTVASSGSIGGSGRVGDLTISGLVAPGNSVGTLSAGNTILDAGGSFQLEMYDWTGAAGTGWDKLAVNGNLTLSNTTLTPFTINLVSMSATNTAGNSFNWNPDVNWTNTFLTYSGSLVGSFDASAFAVNILSFSNATNGTFSIANVTGGLALLYTTAFVPASAFNWNVGSGNWNNSANWTNGSVPVNGNSVIFSGAGGNSTNDALNSVKGVTFTNGAGAYVISGNAFTNGVEGVVNASSVNQTINNDLTLGVGQTFNATNGSLTFGGAINTASNSLSVSGASNTVINGVVSGAGGSVVKSGTGSLILNGANTYTGGTTVSGGTLAGDSTSLQGTIANNAAVEFVQSTNGTYGSVMSGTGYLVKSSAGTLTLSAANTYNGGTLISGGALVVNTATIGGLITNNATLVYNQTVAGTNANIISGTGALIKEGADTLNLNAANTYSGGTVLNAGTLRFNNTSSLGTGTLSIGNGTTIGTTSSSTVLPTNAIVVNGNFSIGTGAGVTLLGTVDLGGTTRTITLVNSTTLAGVVSNGGITLESTSTSRSLTMSNANTYAGGTIVNGGTLAVSGAGSLLSTGSVSLAGATTNTTFDISTLTATSLTIGSLSGATNATVTLGAKNLAVGGANTSTTYSGIISGSGGSLTKSGNGTFTLAGANTYSGGTLVSAGVLAGDTRSLQNAITNNANVIFDQTTNGTYAGAMTGSGILTKNNAGTVTLSGANAYSGGTVVNAGTLAGSTTSLQGAISNSANVEFNQSTNGTYSGVVSGSGSLTKSGSGVVTLSGANTYAGGTVVSAGGLTGDTSSLQGAISNGGTVTFAQSGNGIYGGTLSGAGSLVKSGSGTVILSGANGSFSGAVTVGGGSLAASVDNALGTGSVTVTNGGVIANNGRTIGNNFVLGTAGAGGVYYSQDFNTMGLTAPTGWSIYTGATTNSLGTASSITASNTWGNSTGGFYNYASTTGLTSGSTTTEQNNSTNRALGVRQSSSFGDPGASFDYTFNTLNQNVTSISLDLLMLSAQPRASTWNIEYGLGTNPTSFTLLGTWADPGVWGATSTNFTTNTFGSSLNNQANIVFRFTALNATTNAGNRDTIGIDNFVINTAQPATGSGTLGIEEAGSATFSGNVTVNNAGTLTAAANGQATFSGVLSGAGGITKTGSGTVILSGSNSYSGGTVVSAGTLRGDTTSLQGLITNNATLVYAQNANNATSVTNLAGNGTLVKEGSATLQLGGSSSYAGNTVLNSGAIAVQSANAFGSGAVTINDGTAIGAIVANRTLANNFVINGNFTNGLVGASTNTGSLTINGTVDLGGGARTVYLENSLSLGGIVSNGGLVINNINATNRTLTLGAANTFAGGITLNSGYLSLTHAKGAGTGSITQTDGTSQVRINVAGTVTNDMSVYNVLFQQGANLSGALTLNNTTFDVTNNVTATNSGTLSGTGGVDKIGAGTLLLSGNNSYSGGTSISNGAVSVSADNNLGAVPGSPTAGNVTLDGGKLLAASGFTLHANRGIALGNSGGTIEVASAQSVAYAGVVAGSGSFTKAGAGSLTFSGSNSYSGATTVSGGTLELANTGGAALGSTASVSVASGATLLISQNQQVNNAASISLTGGTIRTAAGISETFGNLTVTGSGFLDFGTTSYANANTINFGTYTPGALLTIANFDFGSTLTFKSNLTSTINDLSFFSFSNGGIASSSWDEGTSTFTITAIPEPSTYLAAAGLLALMLWPSRRRLLKDVKSILGLRAPARARLSH